MARIAEWYNRNGNKTTGGTRNVLKGRKPKQSSTLEKKNPTGAVANRVALEACVQACNEGHDLAREGNEIIREAAKWSPELAAACEVWKEIKFEGLAMDSL
ncbi:hypothetical protein ACB092_09G121300 [Castanea dentata]